MPKNKELQAIQAEVDKNFVAFKTLLPELSKEHSGKYALMRHEDIVQIFDSPGDAAIFAEEKYHDELYSIQQITDQLADLGYFSHALHFRPVQSGNRTDT